MIHEKKEIVSTGVIFLREEEPSVSSARFSKKTKFDLGKIWSQKRDDARKHLQKILEKQKSSKFK